MAWSGGTFTRANPTWVTDAGLGIGIEAGRHDAQDNDFTTGINQCLNKDGSNSATGNLNFGGFLPTNIGAGTAAAPAICAGNDVNTGIFSPAADQIGIATNGTERVRISDTGRVGIGTTAPGANLHISSGPTAGTTNEYVRITNSTAADNITSRLAFYNYSGIASAIDSIQNAGTNFQSQLVFSNQTGSGMTEKMRIDSGGALFINTTANFSADKLCLAFGSAENGLGVRDNNNTSGATFAVFRNSANGICGSVTRVTTTNAVNYNTSSDYRLKENVVPLQDGLQRTLSLRPVGFAWVENGVFAEGFIAHEVANVFAQAVSGSKDEIDANGQPKYQAVDYGKLTPLLTAAIQELNAKVEALETRVAELEA
jgi:hypothetical protein